MKIDKLMLKYGPDVYYEKAFMDTLEAHMEYLRNSPKTQSISVDSHKAVIYEGDLYGYLLEERIQPQYFWTIMRMNNFYSPHEFGPTTESLVIPNFADVDILRQTQKISSTIQL